MSDWTYDLSPFISFRDREACERVRAIRRADLAEHPSPDFARYRTTRDAEPRKSLDDLLFVLGSSPQSRHQSRPEI